MRKVNLILQEILKIMLVFLLSFIWTRYFFRKLWLATLISAAICAAVYALMLIFRGKRNNKAGLKLKEKEDAENMFLSLACEDKPMDFFEKLAKKHHENVTKNKEYLVIHHPEGVATVLFADLSFEGLNVPRFMQIYAKIKKEKATKIVICCKSVTDKNLGMFLSSFKEKFLILDEFETYQKLFKFYDCFPPITRKYGQAKKMTFKDYLSYSFNKKRTKGYFFSALILVFCGLFVRMTIYYCVMASVLVTFALISFFNPRYNPSPDPEIL